MVAGMAPAAGRLERLAASTGWCRDELLRWGADPGAGSNGRWPRGWGWDDLAAVQKF